MDRTPVRHTVAEALPAQRSRIANGTATLLGGKDERSVYVRRLKEIIAEYVAERHDSLSAAQRSLIRRIAVLTIELEKLETRFAEDDSVGERTLDLYNRTAGNLGRLLERLGIKPPARAPLTIQGHLAAKRAEA